MGLYTDIARALEAFKRDTDKAEARLAWLAMVETALGRIPSTDANDRAVLLIHDDWTEARTAMIRFVMDRDAGALVDATLRLFNFDPAER